MLVGVDRVTRRSVTRRAAASAVSIAVLVGVVATGMAPVGAAPLPVRDRALMVAQGDNFATGATVEQTALRPVVATSAASPRSTGSAATRRALRIAVVLLRLPGSVAEPVSRATVNASTFGAKNSVASWFAQTSGGLVTVTGTVYGYYGGVTSCDLSAQLAAGGAAAARDGYVASDYDHLVVYAPAQACGFSGMGWIGESGVFLNGTVAPGVMEHELGHNLGLGHAGAYTCVPAAITCLAVYGDRTDVMGDPSFNRGYSAEHKLALGWLVDSQVRTVTTGTATIALTASENPTVAGAIELIHLRAADGTLYAIERRASVGYDTGVTGVWIRKVESVNGADTELVRSSALAPGASFVDQTHQVTITTLADSGPTASVRVCVGQCDIAAQGQAGSPTVVGSTPRIVATARNSATANSSITLIVPAGGAVAAGRTVVVSTYAGGAIGAVSCHDSRGNAYSVDVNSVGSRRLAVCSARVNATLGAGTRITVRYPRFRGAALAIAGVFSGVKATARVDKTSARGASGVAIDSNTTGRVTRSSELIVGAVAHRGTSSFTSTSVFTRLGGVSYGSGAARLSVVLEYKVVAAPGAYRVTGTLSTGQPWRAAVVTYFPV